MSDQKPFKKVVSRSAFGKNLAKALKKREAEQKAQGDEAAGSSGTTDTPPADSFTKRLTKRLKSAEPAPTMLDEAVTTTAPTADEPPRPASAGPVGGGEHVVKEGECVASIAKETGHFCDTIWNDEKNTELRNARKDRYVLLPGDRIHVPPLREKWEAGKQTEMRHRFRRKGWPEKLQFRILRDGKPRGNQPYTLDVDGKVFKDTTDPDGMLSCPIIPNAKRAILRVGTEPDVTEDVFLLGGMDPIDEIRGIQGRLNNLGFDCGAVDGVCGERTRNALSDYQRSRSLEITGMPDDATRQQLKADYGC